MSVFKRDEWFHFRFTVKGNQYRGSCCTKNRDEALLVEEKARDELKAGNRYDDSIKRNIVREYSRSLRQEQIHLTDAVDVFFKKPHHRQPGQKRSDQIRKYWDDFTTYAADIHQVHFIHQIEQEVAEGYIQFLRSKGAYTKTVSYKRSGNTITSPLKLKHLANRTLNEYHFTCQQVIDSAMTKSGLDRNPFRDIPKLKNKSTDRDAFTIEQLAVIAQKSEFDYPDIYHLFIVGVYCGLRKADICLLMWQSLDKQLLWLTINQRKTQNPVRLPILGNLQVHLRKLPRSGKYVYPELARQYKTQPAEIGRRVRKFLKSECKFKTRRKVKGRDRLVSILDIHSLRHTFCYLAGLNGIPLPIVQSVVGHLTPKMTKHYSDHATDEDKQIQLAKLPVMFGDGGKTKPTPRDEALTLISRLRIATKEKNKLKKLIRQI